MITPKEIAELCCSAYSYNHKNYINNKETDTYLFFDIIDNDLYIIFRGTESSRDVLNDIEFVKQKVPYGNYNTKIRIHSGFGDCYESIRIELFGKIFNKYNSYNNIIITGHSLGGALACLCYIDLIYNFSDKKVLENKKLYLYTFGQPKVGNKYFVNSIKKRTTNKDKYVYYRYVNGDDIVTKVPKINYEHYQDYLINIGKKYWYKLFSFEDHAIKNYIKEIY